MKKQVIPTVLTNNKSEFNIRFKKLLKLNVAWIQIDFMDGKLVNPVSTKLKDVPNLRYYKSKYKKKFEAHLMVKKPELMISKLKEKGFNKIIFHYEAYKNTKKCNSIIKKIKNNNLICYIAINPETNFSKIEKLLPMLDGVMLMGIKPGYEKQKFMPKIFSKIKNIRKNHPNLDIQIDGGINTKIAPKIYKSGANIINSGSFISASEHPSKALRQLRTKFK